MIKEVSMDVLESEAVYQTYYFRFPLSNIMPEKKSKKKERLLSSSS